MKAKQIIENEFDTEPGVKMSRADRAFRDFSRWFDDNPDEPQPVGGSMDSKYDHHMFFIIFKKEDEDFTQSAVMMAAEELGYEFASITTGTPLPIDGSKPVHTSVTVYLNK